MINTIELSTVSRVRASAEVTRPKLALPRQLVLAVSLVLLTSHLAAALDPVSVKLKSKHQFQFTGYYARLEQGFYREAGLDVIIREDGPGIDVAETVDFGGCSSSVLCE
jgi:ABC-type nitrate/sulfonate/bicarbonate transport system substrate-binding protein